MLGKKTRAMTILVCPLSHVARLVEARAPELVVSLLDPGWTFPELGSAFQDGHLRLRLHDVHSSRDGEVAPTTSHIDDLLAFVGRWQRTGPILFHCRAGIGRSPAAAFIAACFLNPEAAELEVARSLRRVSPTSRPNESLIGLADGVMGRGGRMSTAIAETGRGLPWPAVDEGFVFEMPLLIRPNPEGCIAAERAW
jgi:predicted protein tyrosine phosphatase